MMIYFLRHAEAEDAARSDFDRKLTPKGLEQADKVGKFCARNGLIPELILTSPVVRAEQTATIVAKRLGADVPTIERWIACGMAPETFFAEMVAYKSFGSVMLVGHEPDFSSVIGSALGLQDASEIRVRKASLTLVELRALSPGRAALHFSIPVRLM